MTDGHTKLGSYRVTLELSGDQVKQLTRLIEMAKMMDGRKPDPKGTENMELLAHREFLEEILTILYEGLK